MANALYPKAKESFINGHILTVDGGWSATRYLSAT